MGRLDVQIRHGGGGGSEWGAVIALVLFIVLAVAGGVGHKALASAAHGVAPAITAVMWTLAAVVILAATAGVGYAVVRIRGAVRVARARRAIPPPAITVTPVDPRAGYLPPGTGRPAIDAPRAARPWPLPDGREESRPRIGGDSDEHRRR
jgi:hypothetical protein